jgi:hypothetical protein
MLNKQIFETLYYGAMEASCELAEEHGPYETYEGCPVSKGIFQVGYFITLIVPVELCCYYKKAGTIIANVKKFVIFISLTYNLRCKPIGRKFCLDFLRKFSSID